MSSYRLLGQFTQYFLDDGRVNAGGSISFYETDLTTPKTTYSDPDLTTANPNPVPLDAAGRPQNDIWGDGQYGAVLKDKGGVTLETRNHIQSGADAGFVIPALETGKFLTNDGSNLLWDDVGQVPDPSGFSGDVLYSDGSLSYWGPLPDAPTPESPDIVVGTKSFQAGTTDNANKYYTQWGTATAPASGAAQTTQSVTFDEEFSSAPVVVITPYASVQSGGNVVTAMTAAPTATGFTATFDVAEGSGASPSITNAVPFCWVAIGIKNVVPPVTP